MRPYLRAVLLAATAVVLALMAATSAAANSAWKSSQKLWLGGSPPSDCDVKSASIDARERCAAAAGTPAVARRAAVGKFWTSRLGATARRRRCPASSPPSKR